MAALAGSPECAELIFGLGADVNAADHHGNTPLHDAAHTGKISCIEFLVSSGADINAVNNTGNTPLMQAAIGESENALLAMIETGADMDIANKAGETALHIAAQGHNSRCADILLKAGADPFKATFFGWTALHTAASYGRIGMMKNIIRRGGSLFAPDKKKCTPLDILKEYSYDKYVEYADKLIELDGKAAAKKLKKEDRQGAENTGYEFSGI